jgi:hypothetical protein
LKEATSHKQVASGFKQQRSNCQTTAIQSSRSSLVHGHYHSIKEQTEKFYGRINPRHLIGLMKNFVIATLLTICIIVVGLSVFSNTPAGKRWKNISGLKEQSLAPKRIQRLISKATDAKTFAQKNDFNTGFCFLIDMGVPSNKKRFFIYDLEKDSVVNSGLVTHGNCNHYWLDGRKYGNTVGCGCTSLGKYKIGYSYTGRFGLAFKLYGLESTNSNAFARYVVLHSHSCVPETEVNSDICQSNGCPTVSSGFLKILEPLIRNSKKPVLLWIFN